MWFREAGSETPNLPIGRRLLFFLSYSHPLLHSAAGSCDLNRGGILKDPGSWKGPCGGNAPLKINNDVISDR